MAVEKNLTQRQAQSDLKIGLDSLEELRGLAARYRTRMEEAYGSALKSMLQNLLALHTQSVQALQKYLEEFHPDAPVEPSPEGRLLRPDVPEWRPGPSSSSGTD